MKKELKFRQTGFEAWINTFILAKDHQLIDTIYFAVTCAIFLIGSANIFGKFLSLIYLIVILIIYFGLTGFMEYRLFINPFLSGKGKDNKLLVRYRYDYFIAAYIMYGIFSCILLYFITHWAVLGMLLFHILSYSMWAEDLERIKIGHKHFQKHFISIYGKDIVDPSPKVIDPSPKDVQQEEKKTINHDHQITDLQFWKYIGITTIICSVLGGYFIVSSGIIKYNEHSGTYSIK